MKKLLFINGCVRGENSRTLQIAFAYLDVRKGQGDVVVSQRNLDGVGYLCESSFDSETGLQKPMDTSLAEEFASADEILLASPYWEFLFPAVVGCYFENVSIAGKTFQYTEKGSEGLCKADSFKYIYTAGDYIMPQDRLSEMYLQKLARLYGIDNFSAILADGLDIQGNDAQQIVADVCGEIKKGKF